MTATFAASARPLTAAIAWATKDGLFVEIPCRDGPPLICRYHRTAEGLALALNVLIERPETESRTITASHPKARVVAKDWSTEAQRETARAVLKKMGLT